MKITNLTARLITREMGGALWNPRTRWHEKTILLVFVETDGGHVGVGEAWTSQGSPRALAAVIDDDIRPKVVGEDPFFVERVFRSVFRTTELSGRTGITLAALSAVDLALWDLIGKLTGTPLYRLLGAHSDRVFCYASAGLYGTGKTAEDLGAEMAGYVARGFAMVKMKVGGAPFAEDVKRVAAAREAIGPERRLMVDGLYNFTVPDALRFARAIERYDIEWFEAPVSPYDIEGEARINAGPIPVCGNETEAGIDAFRRLITAGAVSLVQFDVAACGGISEGRRIADLAAAFHLPCTLHASSTSVLLAASLHLGAALSNCHSVEYHMLHQWLFEHAPEGAFAVEDGFVRPPEGPGFGVSLTPDDLESGS